MRVAIFLLGSIFFVVSCASLKSLRNPVAAQSHINHDVFSDLLKRNASRIDVEVIAALGEHYATDENLDGTKLRRVVIKSLATSGMSNDSPYGNTVYRVTRLAQSRRLLAKTWPNMDFSQESELGLLFQHNPRASIAIMECDDQRIFFFDNEDRLVAIYPKGGGGC